MYNIYFVDTFWGILSIWIQVVYIWIKYIHEQLKLYNVSIDCDIV